MKKLTSLLLVISLLMLMLGVIPVSADRDSPQVYGQLLTADDEYVTDEIIVKYKNDNKPFRVVKVPAGRVKDKIKEFNGMAEVEYAEPNYVAHAMEVNDPNYSYQWNFRGQDEGGIRADEAWSSSIGSGVIVAVVDTGIAYENYEDGTKTYYKAPDLASTKIIDGYDFVNGDSHANDDNSHGTHVAGTVAQSTNNRIGVAGIAYGATLMPVKVLDSSGYGTYANIADGIDYATDNGARVINLSLGGESGSQTLLDAVKRAHDAGVTVVCAAGNDASDTISFPAAYNDYVIAVGATRYDKTLSYYSNYGIGLDVVAPGGDTSIDQNGDGYIDGILQNTFNPNTKVLNSFGYYFFQGTSMASPHVAGVAALIIANGNTASPDEVQALLQDTALDLGADGWDITYGYGLVDAYSALGGVTYQNTAPVAYPQVVNTVEDIACNIVLTASDAENDPLTFSVVTGPSIGTLSGAAPNLTYTPGLNNNGSDSFTYKVYDGKVYSDIVTVNIDIEPVNDQPVAASQTLSTTIGKPIGITLSASDVDNASLTYTVISGPAGGTLSGTAPNLTYTPPNTAGDYYFTFVANDGSINSEEATVSIRVTETAPVQYVNVSISLSTATKRINKVNYTYATAKITVGTSGDLKAGAKVNGHWAGLAGNTVTGVTGTTGTVSLVSAYAIPTKTNNTFTFVVDNVDIGSDTYLPSGTTSKSITVKVK